MNNKFCFRILSTLAILRATCRTALDRARSVPTHLAPALLLICLGACGIQHPAQPAHRLATWDSSAAVRPPDANHVTLVGRFETLPPSHAVRFGWPNSAMGFNFDGDAIGIVLAEDALRTVGPNPVHNMYEVVVDGEVMPPITVTSTMPQTFPIAEGLLPGLHTAWVIKRTEGMVGSGVFMGLDVPQQTQLLPPPPRRDRRIEVYGASNEAGYGNLGRATREHMCTYSTATQNAAVAYPALVANALQADLVNISFSGKGMLRTCTPGDSYPLPALADRIAPMDPAVVQRDPAQAPQVVLVTLGANDFGLGTPNKKAFATGLRGFFAQNARAVSQCGHHLHDNPHDGWRRPPTLPALARADCGTCARHTRAYP